MKALRGVDFKKNALSTTIYMYYDLIYMYYVQSLENG